MKRRLRYAADTLVATMELAAMAAAVSATLILATNASWFLSTPVGSALAAATSAAVEQALGLETPDGKTTPPIATSGGSVATLAALTTILKELPDEVISGMDEDGWQLALVGEEGELRDLVGAEVAADRVTGVTVFSERRIYLLDDPDSVPTTILHEVAHVLDMSAGWFSSSAEWQEAYAAEKGPYAETNAYASSSDKEMFAEVCNDLLLAREEKLTACPCCSQLASAFLDGLGAS